MCAGVKEVISYNPFQYQDSQPMLRQSEAIQGEDDSGTRVNEAGQDRSFGLDTTYEDEV